VDGFTGKRRFIENRPVRSDHRRDRKDFAGAHHEHIADGDLVDGHRPQAARRPSTRNARGAIQQRSEILGRATLGGDFERLPHCEHYPDQRARQILVNGQRAYQCEHRDDVGAHAAPVERGDHPPHCRRNGH
jgi:hypothetical protein